MQLDPPLVDNPFALMMQPEAVLRRVEHSSALRQLRLRKYHLLDDPQPRAPAVGAGAYGGLCPRDAEALAQAFLAKAFPALVN